MLTPEQEWAAEDDGGPETPPPPAAILCPACGTVAPRYRALRVGREQLRLEPHGPGYPAAPCPLSWQVSPPGARLAGLGDPQRPDPTPAAPARPRAEVAAVPLFGAA